MRNGMVRFFIIIIFIGFGVPLKSQDFKVSRELQKFNQDVKSEVSLQKKVLHYTKLISFYENDIELANSGISGYKSPSEIVLLQIKDSVGTEARDFILRLNYLHGLFNAAIPIDNKLKGIKSGVEFISFATDYVVNEKNLNLLGSYWREVKESDQILDDTFIKPLEGLSSLTISYSNFKTDLNNILKIREIKIIVSGYKYTTTSTDQRDFIATIKAIHASKHDNLCEKNRSFIERVVQDFDETKEFVFIKYPKVKKYFTQ